MLFHLRHGLRDGAEGEVRIDADGGQLLSLSLRDQHVVALQRQPTVTLGPPDQSDPSRKRVLGNRSA